MTEPDVAIRRWTRLEYERLVDKGIFAPGVRLVALALTRAFGDGWDVRMEGPIALDDDSEPEPDVAVVRGSLRDYLAAHPADPVLVVEVALTSLAFDRERKSSLYARAGRPEYWIVNLVDRVLEVRREPVRSGSASFGWHYRGVEVLGTGDAVSPLAAPSARVAVADLLP